MEFPERFSNLPEYAFPRLRALLDHHPAGGSVLPMSIGEPQHAFPSFVSEIIAENAVGFGKYPPNDGSGELLHAISDWIGKRYGVAVDAERQILALNGTREGLFAAAVALCAPEKNGKPSKVLMPNPFYQVYAVGSVTANAEPVYVNAGKEHGFLPNFSDQPEDVLEQTVAAFICSPSNPQGAVATKEYWRDLISLAEKYDFRVFADECYSEIYAGDAPKGALEVSQAMGADPERVVIFHSLSKRSNLPGLRSGFAAGGTQSIAAMKKLRAYAGAPLPAPLQAAAAACWRDEDHVIENRALYVEKYALADKIFEGVEGYTSPKAGFFLWLGVGDGEQACLQLWKETGVRVLPGAYLGRETPNGNPGEKFIRVAMVAPKDQTEQGLHAIRECLY